MKKTFLLFCVFLMACAENALDIKNMDDTLNGAGNDINALLATIECGCVDKPIGVLAWEYPVIPYYIPFMPFYDEEGIFKGDLGWRELDDYEVWLNACQIPNDVLSSLSTEDLTVICLNYPLLFDYTQFFSKEEGFTYVYNSFNGLRELFKREDGYKELLKHYNVIAKNPAIIDDYYWEMAYGIQSTIMGTCQFFPLKLLNFVPDWREVMMMTHIEFLLRFYHSEEDNATDKYKEILQCFVSGYKKNPMGTLINYYSRLHLINKICETCYDTIPDDALETLSRSGYVTANLSNIINELSYQLIK